MNHVHTNSEVNRLDGRPFTDPRLEFLEAESEALRAKLNSPELVDFAASIAIAMVRYTRVCGAGPDRSVAPAEWVWLINSELNELPSASVADDPEKTLYHIAHAAALLAKWHAIVLAKVKSS